MQHLLKTILRVNHAGEYGAVRIYKGQNFILKLPILEEMQKQEEAHLLSFQQLLIVNKVTPTILEPIWHIGGFALGVMTAILGEKSAHACTIAVEEVIENHYTKQLDNLNDSPLKDIIKSHLEDEMHHKETAEILGGKNSLFFPIIHKVVTKITEKAIWLSERI